MRRRPRASGSALPVGRLIARLRRVQPDWRITALAEVSAERRDPFYVLIACILSLRTKDETTGPAASRLFALAEGPEAMGRLPARQIERAIFPVGFYRTKARVILGICRDLLERFGGAVPDRIDELLTLKGVGRKTANLVVTMGFGKPGICVDVHVHRISNRWGVIRTRNPSESEAALRRRLPRRYWIGYNDLLVAFGQNICQPVSPHCSICPLAGACPRIGVTRSR
jgi:endonuclease III